MNSYGIAYRDLCSKARSTIMSTQRQVVLMQQKGKQTQVCSSESTRNQADVLRVNKYNLRGVVKSTDFHVDAEDHMI